MDTKYEVTNKETGAVSPVTAMTFGDGIVEAKIEETITFLNPNAEGNLTNDLYTITEVGTGNLPNGEPSEETTA